MQSLSLRHQLHSINHSIVDMQPENIEFLRFSHILPGEDKSVYFRQRLRMLNKANTICGHSCNLKIVFISCEWICGHLTI